MNKNDFLNVPKSTILVFKYRFKSTYTYHKNNFRVIVLKQKLSLRIFKVRLDLKIIHSSIFGQKRNLSLFAFCVMDEGKVGQNCMEKSVSIQNPLVLELKIQNICQK